MEEIINEIKLFAKKGVIKKDGCVAIRDNDTMYISKNGIDLSNLSKNEMVLLKNDGSNDLSPYFFLYASIFEKRKDVNAIFLTHLPNILTASKSGKTIKPMLDDMAQIVGISVKNAGDNVYTSASKITKAVKKLNDRTALMLKDNGAICVGSTIDDAAVSAIVFDKGCKTWIETFFLGGGKYIATIECWIMHKVYQLKYSKQAKSKK